MIETTVYQLPFYKQREIMKLPPSAKFILFLLKLKGSMNRKRIIQETMMPDRTVGFALKLLLDKNLIEKERAGSKKSLVYGKRRRRKQDRRIANYNLISTALPYEMAEV
ncbi:MAG: hypothetical protein HWN66_18705 [Candidatus Helarchaeota archaeon]|nr:hypothetical protein [Candidatus Helarchaeota archaeon]